MSVQEDLDDSLEEFCRLQRLGDFASAKRFFADNLQEHLYKPNILIEYAEMLLEQGDYNSLSEIDCSTIYDTADNDEDSSDGRLLRSYWYLMQVLISCHKPDMVLHDYSNIMTETFFNLDIIESSVFAEEKEIKMVAMANRISLFQERLRDLFYSPFYRSLYAILLRQGRIWDLHDISVARMTIQRLDVSWDWSDDPSPRQRIQNLIKDWSSAIKGYDTSTTLALLSILVPYVQSRSIDLGGKADALTEYVMEQSTLLAASVMENDPNSMRSRPFVRWMLAKSHTKCPGQLDHQLEYIDSYPGMVFHNKDYTLPGYVPLKIENPGWKVHQVASDIEEPVRTAVKASQLLGDYRTEANALQLLITFSAKPTQEFEALGNLQNKTQGDILNYTTTLISKYLICDTEASRNDLKREISEPLSNPLLHTYIGHLQSWALWMLRHALETDGSAAKKDLEKANEIYKGLDGMNQRSIDERFYVEYHLSIKDKKFPTPGFSETELQSKEDWFVIDEAGNGFDMAKALVKWPIDEWKETTEMGSERLNAELKKGKENEPFLRSEYQPYHDMYIFISLAR
ncbi:hypothetical protein Daesc_000497 [Daldinia eschscholtzii]|uniref:Uncharacterized protein n=1 Tax=Daldinia eschscholtzii TaxID=292717 RepID=A0AAX6MYM1_9PEZI